MIRLGCAPTELGQIAPKVQRALYSPLFSHSHDQMSPPPPSLLISQAPSFPPPSLRKLIKRREGGGRQEEGEREVFSRTVVLPRKESERRNWVLRRGGGATTTTDSAHTSCYTVGRRWCSHKTQIEGWRWERGRGGVNICLLLRGFHYPYLS